MSSEYYSIEEAAKILNVPSSELTGERSQVRAFRDGSSWKFRKADVDKHLAELIKKRSQNNQAAEESDFDLLNDADDEAPTLLADQPSFDSLSNSLPDEDQMISLSKEDNDDGLMLDDDLVMADDDLKLSDDSDMLVLQSTPSSSDVDLAVDDDDLVLDSGSSAQLDLAGDSGLSLLDVADDDLQTADKGGSDDDLIEFEDILSLADDDLAVDSTSTIAIPVEDDFQLVPDNEMAVADDSESASQVIALDEENVFGGQMDGSSGFGSAVEAPPGPGAGFGAPATYGATAGEFVSAAPTYVAPATTAEASYGPMSVVFLFFLASVLALAGVMVLDLIIHIWSWGEPFVISSTLMDMIAGMAGLK